MPPGLIHLDSGPWSEYIIPWLLIEVGEETGGDRVDSILIQEFDKKMISENDEQIIKMMMMMN